MTFEEAIKKVVEHFKSLTPEAQFKAWSDAAESLKNSIDAVTQAYDDLQATLEDLEATKDKLNTLDKDSVEYQKIVLETNRQTIDLLKQ